VYSGGFEKGTWYDLFTNYADTPNMFSMACSKVHATRKRMMSNIYSKSFLQASPTLTALTRTIILDRLVPRLDELASDGKGFNVYSELAAATMDFVTGYQFGAAQSSNFIRNVGLREEYLDWYTRRIGFNFWPQEHPKLTEFMSSLGIELVPKHVSEANSAIEDWTVAMCDAATTFLRSSGALKVEDVPQDEQINYPMVFSQISTAMSKSKDYADIEAGQRRLELASEMLDHLAAGFDTSSITLCYVVHELSQRPDVQAKLREELRTLIAPMSPERTDLKDVVSSKQLDALPYLDAVLQETLRLRAAIPGPQPRITPPGGCSLGPQGEYDRIPEGIRISAQAHSLHRNAEVFDQPDKWLPSRWLEVDEEKAKEMRRWFWAFGSGGRMCVGSNLAIYSE
jgi:cytochrome P450